MIDQSTDAMKIQSLPFVLPDQFLLYLAASLGALILYMINRTQNKQPFSLFQVINIDSGRQAKFYIVITDMIVSSLLGGVVIMLMSRPENSSQSFMSGLGLTGLLSPFAQNLQGNQQ